MICKIFLKPKKGNDFPIIPIVCQSDLNSFIYRSLGNNNKWHDSFSEYSVSSIQNGKLYDRSYLKFTEQPFVQVTSMCDEFIEDLIIGLNRNKYEFFGMVFDRVEMTDFDVWKRYDKVMAISPVIVKDDNRRMITPDDDRFLYFLKKNCLDKLGHHGIYDKTFDIEFVNKDKCKVKGVRVGKIWNIATLGLFRISGKKCSRELIYNLGLGGSTGSGFGAVKLYDR